MGTVLRLGNTGGGEIWTCVMDLPWTFDQLRKIYLIDFIFRCDIKK